MSKVVAVIDGNSLMHRAYHAVPPTMAAPDGTPTNAVFGFIAMLLKFIETARPSAIICAFDAGKPEFRIAEMQRYKATRPPMDNELRVQFPIMEEVLGALSIPVIKVKGWEGDDILGTIASRDEEKGFQTLLVTGDKDAYQLATENTHIVTTKKGITDVAIYGPAEVEERYGVTPAQFADFLGLMGDSSDNIPGVPGIGPKTAAKLLQRFDSIEGIYDHINELKGKQKENLQNNKEEAFLSRQVATIITDLTFPLDLDDVEFPSFSAEAVQETFTKYQLNSQMTRILRLIGAKPQTTEVALVWQPLLTGDAARALVQKAIDEGDTIGVDFFDADQISLFEEGTNATFATAQGCARFESQEALDMLAFVIRKGRFASLDVKRLVHYVYPADTGRVALVSADDVRAMNAFDLGIAAYILNSSVSEYSLMALCDQYCKGALPESNNSDERSAIRAAATRALVEPLTQALKRDGSSKPYFDIDLPLVSVLTTMERIGAAIDSDQLMKMGITTADLLESLRVDIFDIAGEEFNIDSPKQLSRILFEVLGLPPSKKTRVGYSTEASVLSELAHVHPLPQLIISYRELAKLKSTYIDALPALRAPGDGRVHTTFNETVTTTGRLSSSNPNLQNIPVRTDFGRQIRACFIPLNPEDVYLSADYSQIELRVLAHLSGDENLIEAFNGGADFHASTASHVFGVPVDDITPEMRSRAKAVNFGIVYGQQAYGLSQSLEIPFDEAKEMIDRYFEVFPRVRAYLDETVAQARQTGYAVTMFGRKRHIPEIKAYNANQRAFGERTAMNHPMQGSAADIIKMAMNEVDRRMAANDYGAQLMLQVHDELDFSVAAAKAHEFGAVVKDVMESIVTLKVPLVVDVKTGVNWALAH